MNPQEQFCPNEQCHASGRIGKGNIRVHSQKARRYRCDCCGRTFSARKGTPLYWLKRDEQLFETVASLLAYGCPLVAIVATYGLHEATVRRWQAKAAEHCQRLHHHQMSQEPLDLGQVQADEMRVKSQAGVVWLAMAVMVSTRLWLGAVASRQRDRQLLSQLVDLIRRLALCRPLLLAVDGLPGYIKLFQRAFRSPLRLGRRGAPLLIPWTNLAIVQVVKQRQADTLLIHQRVVVGRQALVNRLLAATQGGGTINTAYIERLNATFRQRLAPLARRSRSLARQPQTIAAGAYLIGTVYNFCTFHHTLRLPLYLPRARRWVQRTPAMAAGLTDHPWSIAELLRFKVPSLYRPPKRRGRPPKIVCSCGLV